MTDNVTIMSAEPTKEQIAALAELLECEPVFGEPQITDKFVYQCAVKNTEIGKQVFFRTWPRWGVAAAPKLKDGYWLALDCYGDNYGDNYESCQFVEPVEPDEDWKNAKATFEEERAVRNWRGEEIAAQYYEAPWNVDGLMQPDAIAWVYGAPGSYKTVLAMDLSCCIATGQEWCGRKTRKGPVLYITAEGGAGIYAIRDAWEQKNGVKAKHLAIFDGSPDIANINLSDGYERRAHPLIDVLNQFQNVLSQPAALIVIDTYAQTSPDDTKAAVTAYEKRLRRLIREVAPGASVLVIDHTTKEGGTWMGSNAKLGNMDMMGLVKKTGDDIILTMRGGKGKVKNAPAFDDIRLRPRLINLGRKDAYGREAVAPVLDYCETVLTEREALVLELLGDGATYQDLRTAWHDHAKHKALSTQARKAGLSRTIRGLRDKDFLGVEGLQYEQTEDGSKERPLTDACLLFPL